MGKPKTKQPSASKLPSDWKVIELGKIAKITSGGTPRRDNKAYWGGQVPWITTSLIDFNHIEKAEEFITIDGLKNSSTKLFPPGTILMALYGQGITRGKTAILQIEAATNQACAAIILDNQKAHNQFVFQYLIGKYKDIRKLSNTGNQENLSGELVKSIRINLPPISEQKAIANILTLMDITIRKLNELITKKELRKKWLIQNLLTGKKRLLNNKKGIKNCKWITVKMGDVFEFIKTYSISREGLSKANNKDLIYCIHYGDIHAFYENEFLDFSVQQGIPQIVDDTQAINERDYLKEGDIVMADASEDYEGVGEVVEVINLENKIAVGGLHTIVLRGNKKIIVNGFSGYLFSGEIVRNRLRKLATGTSVYSVTKTTLQNLSLSIPSSLKEQTAIANVLQAVDKEIQLLKLKRDKL